MRSNDPNRMHSSRSPASDSAAEALRAMQTAMLALDRASLPGHIAAQLQTAIDALKESVQRDEG